MSEEDADVHPSSLDMVLRVSTSIGDIENVPITISELLLHSPFLPKDQLFQGITRHYTNLLLSQFYKILGSFDFLGNPISLINSLGQGTMSFFSEPFQGSTPKDIVEGVAKGTGKFLKSAVFAVFDTTSRITNSVSRVVEFISLDDKYIRLRNIRRHKKSRHVGEGIVFGLRDLVKGISQGLIGIIEQPYIGAKEEGVEGALKGVAKGFTGIVAKPVVGVIDLITRTSEGIKNTTTIFDNLKKERIRPPRYFGNHRLLEIYNKKKLKDN